MSKVRSREYIVSNPRKPKPYCSYCEEEVSEKDMPDVCPHCGQTLDWSSYIREK